jgi:hypothetical protein
LQELIQLQQQLLVLLLLLLLLLLHHTSPVRCPSRNGPSAATLT